MEEIWRDVVGMEDFLKVSNLGRVATKDRIVDYVRNEKHTYRARKGEFLTPYVAQNTYKTVHPMIKGYGRKKYLVHRLVGMAFVPGYEEGLSINHINNDKMDNRPENLEWVTLAVNTQKQWRDGLVNLRGENQPGHKLTAKQVINIRKMLKMGVKVRAIADLCGVSDSLIRFIGEGKRWGHLKDDSEGEPA